MKDFSGLCVGGPLAGKRLAHSGRSYKVAVRVPMPANVLSGPAPAAESIQHFTYVWTYLPSSELSSPGILGFWMPEGRDVFWAVGELIASYEACRGR